MMDWIIWHHLLWFMLGALTGDVGWAIVKRLWRAIGRRHDQRQNQPHPYHGLSLRGIVAKYQQQQNGATSSATRRSRGHVSGPSP